MKPVLYSLLLFNENHEFSNLLFQVFSPQIFIAYMFGVWSCKVENGKATFPLTISPMANNAICPVNKHYESDTSFNQGLSRCIMHCRFCSFCTLYSPSGFTSGPFTIFTQCATGGRGQRSTIDWTYIQHAWQAMSTKQLFWYGKTISSVPGKWKTSNPFYL